MRAFEALGVEELILSPWALPFAVIEPEIVDVFAEERDAGVPVSSAREAVLAVLGDAGSRSTGP